MVAVSRTLSYLRTTPLGELVTGSAYEAHPTDVTAPLGVRFAGRTILALHVALEKAATVRVAFDAAGSPRLNGIRHIRQRSSAELTDVLRAEAAATRAEWAVIVLATGWQAVLGQRSGRPEAGERGGAFSRYKLLFETPEVLVPRAQVDRVYTAVDHPALDKSVVFSVRRREVEDLVAEIRKCGLGVAAVRIAVAAQLEVWLAREGEAGLTRDLLITDGLSALLLNVDQGDFVLPRSAIEAEQPRQAVQRPSAVEEDVSRFIAGNGGRSVTFVGPDDLCAAVKKRSVDVEIVRPLEHPAHDTQHVALTAAVRHDLNFEAREVRAALPRSWRRFVIGYAVVGLAFVAIAVTNMVYGVRIGYDSYRIQQDSEQQTTRTDTAAAAMAKMAGDFAQASALRAWVGSNYHAQQFCHELLHAVPQSAALDKLLVEMNGGQITVTFVVLGDQETQLAAHRAMERAVTDLRYKIGGEDAAIAAAGPNRSIQYRMHLIAPDAADVSS